MPTNKAAKAKPPGQKRNISETVAFGREQMSKIARPFFNQWSQPAFLKLASSTFGERCIHSTQIKGFSEGTLRDASMKPVVALGELNEAIARSQGIKSVGNGIRCPGAIKELWQDKVYMRDNNGKPIGAEIMLSIFAGLIDLKIGETKEIPVSKEKLVSKALGKHLRMSLQRQDYDWLDRVKELNKKCPIAENLLMGKPVKGTQIVNQFNKIANISKESAEDLWQLIVTPML
tara:strand:- start:5400 stop:6095 length:696 start_codon:yes stop_codon:yes gene_type:complete